MTARESIAALEADLMALSRMRARYIGDGLNEAVHLGDLRDHIRSVLARVWELEAALTWYGEQARLCRLIHSDGDAGRRALDADGGERARAALNGEA